MAVNDFMAQFIKDFSHIALPHKGTQTIITDNLVLKRITAQDLPYCDEWAQNEESLLFHAKRTLSRSELPPFVDYMTERYQRPTTYFWLFHERMDVTGSQHKDSPVLDENGQPIVWYENGVPYSPYSAGIVYVDRVTCYTTCAEIDMVLGRKYWPTEHMPEALSAMLDYLFDEVGMHRASIRFRADNLPGIRMLKRMGFHHDGTLRELFPSLQVENSWYDADVFSLLAEDWHNQKALNKPYNLAY